MQNWINQVFSSGQLGFVAIPAAALLGLTTFASSVGCCVPIVGIVAGYAGSRPENNRRGIFVATGCFFAASVVSLAAIGALISYFGQTVSESFGFYGKVLIGLIAIFFGLIALELVPFHLPSFKPAVNRLPRGMLGASILGLTLGVASTTCSLACCAPIQLPIVLGMATLQGKVLMGSLILAVFAVGYSLPMAALMLGISFGGASKMMARIARPLRIISGLILIAMGLWIILG